MQGEGSGIWLTFGKAGNLSCVEDMYVTGSWVLSVPETLEDFPGIHEKHKNDKVLTGCTTALSPTPLGALDAHMLLTAFVSEITQARRNYIQ